MEIVYWLMYNDIGFVPTILAYGQLNWQRYNRRDNHDLSRRSPAKVGAVKRAGKRMVGALYWRIRVEADVKRSSARKSASTTWRDASGFRPADQAGRPS